MRNFEIIKMLNSIMSASNMQLKSSLVYEVRLSTLLWIYKIN